MELKLVKIYYYRKSNIIKDQLRNIIKNFTYIRN